MNKRVSWTGWLIAGLLLVQSAASGLAAPADGNPLEGRLLQRSDGTWYVYHAGLKFTVHAADIGDQVIDAIPTASLSQWDALFAAESSSTPERSGAGAGNGPAGTLAPTLPGQPVPFPAYS